MANLELDELIGRVMRREASAAERKQLRELLSTLNEAELNAALDNAMQAFLPLQSPFDQQDSENILQAVLGYTDEVGSRKTLVRPLWKRLGIAASIIAILCTTVYLLKDHNKPELKLLAAEDISPAKKGVSLKVSTGEIINLSTVSKGMRNTPDGVRINEQTNAIAYTNTTGDNVVWHTLSNNSAEKYLVTLNDGTSLYLDIASSITFPTAFKGNERKVFLTGQAYFSVHHNASQPFRVQAGEEIVEDIGTSFNIYAYPDDPVIKTTLLEGAAEVRSINGRKNTVLKPGELAVLENAAINVRPADTEVETAWLQGKLIMRRESLESILKKVSRIYDVQIIWMDSDLKNIQCGGALSRTKTLSNILDFIRRVSPVDFKVEGKIVKVFKRKK